VVVGKRNKRPHLQFLMIFMEGSKNSPKKKKRKLEIKTNVRKI
jgi:hypothetical protein